MRTISRLKSKSTPKQVLNEPPPEQQLSNEGRKQQIAKVLF